MPVWENRIYKEVILTAQYSGRILYFQMSQVNILADVNKVPDFGRAQSSETLITSTLFQIKAIQMFPIHFQRQRLQGGQGVIRSLSGDFWRLHDYVEENKSLEFHQAKLFEKEPLSDAPCHPVLSLHAGCWLPGSTFPNTTCHMEESSSNTLKQVSKTLCQLPSSTSPLFLEEMTPRVQKKDTHDS